MTFDGPSNRPTIKRTATTFFFSSSSSSSLLLLLFLVDPWVNISELAMDWVEGREVGGGGGGGGEV